MQGAGNRTRLTYPDSTYITYDYDNLNRLTAVRNSGGTALASYTYDSRSRRTALEYRGQPPTICRRGRMSSGRVGPCPDSPERLPWGKSLLRPPPRFPDTSGPLPAIAHQGGSGSSRDPHPLRGSLGPQRLSTSEVFGGGSWAEFSWKTAHQRHGSDQVQAGRTPAPGGHRRQPGAADLLILPSAGARSLLVPSTNDGTGDRFRRVRCRGPFCVKTTHTFPP